jgi:hypothetical protein
VTDDFSTPKEFYAVLKPIAAMLGIQLYPYTDTFGRTHFTLDRDGMVQMRDAAREHGFPELADGIQEMLNAGPNAIGPEKGTRP